MAGAVNPAAALPPLRDEIHCSPGPTQFDGSPAWTLHDPANNRFFRIGWLEYEILSRWALADPAAIVESVNAETTLNIDHDDIERLARFLQGQQLLYPGNDQAVRQLRQQFEAGRKHLGSWLLHNYLFFKIPLFRPDALLSWIYPRLAWIYSREFAALVLVCAVLGIYLVSRQWEHFLNTFPHFFNWQGAVQYFLALSLAKILHEFGHALTAHRFGCRVPSMGVAFMVMYPMLYTDANETWKLNSRRQRLAIAGAGIAAELGLAAFATLAWSFMEDGPLRSATFLLASSTWILTLAINLSPFMRFDGYYLLADWMRIENLQPRAFAYNVWLLRRLFFGIDIPPPEQVPPRIARFFTLYASGTWLYRLTLFLGIAWMVYQFFFKLLGIFLMAVEIGWFIVRPIWREIRDWPGLVRERRSMLRFTVIAALPLAVLFIPWQRHLELPAQIRPMQYAEVYLPYPAKLDGWQVAQGQPVNQGALLAALSSSELHFKAGSAERESATLSWQLAYQTTDEQHRKQRQIQLSRLESAATKQAGYSKQLAQLNIQAPLSGTVMEINQQIHAGQWLKAGELLMILADTSQHTVEAYVSEQELINIPENTEGLFYPDNPEMPALYCRLQNVDGGSSHALPALLASPFGGPVAARQDKDNQLVPEQAQYRLLLAVDDEVQGHANLTPKVLRGTLRLATRPASIADRFWKQAFSKILQESSF